MKTVDKKIEISRETKITLLKALKNGYFEMSDLSNLVSDLYGDISDEELDERINELSRKLGIPPLETGVS